MLPHALPTFWFNLTLVRFREFWREPESMFWVLVFPILLAAGLGLAFGNRAPEILKVAAVTPELATSLRHEALLDVGQLTMAEGEVSLLAGKVALLVLPGPGGSVLYHYDESRPDGRTARMLADRAIQRAAGRLDPIAASDVIVVETGSRYIDFLVPGLVGMNIMNSAIWGVGYSIVDARRKRLLKRLIATPMPRHYYLLSFLIWRMLFLIVEVGILLAFSMLVFHVTVRGSWLEFAILCVISSLSFTALGLLIASRAQTIEVASGLMNLAFMFMGILSGIFFSAQRFPDMLQPVIKVLPLTAAIDALRAHMLEGASLAQVGHQSSTRGLPAK